ncbi:MAG TPA: hypothetical protein VHD91_10300 [Gaiellaceae bacterium]|nr:hypothetical protein [Gaiellaceae bacterium]
MPRRFAVLAAVLVALNVFLWIVPAGMALRQSVINQLFGPAMIRAEVVVQSGPNSTQDYRIDRGVVTAATPAQVTLREQDGTVQTIPLAPSTRMSGVGRNGLAALVRRGVQVLVVRPANGAAISLDVEGQPLGGGGQSRRDRRGG